MIKQVDKTLADKLTEIACQQYKTSYDFKKPRMEECRLNEEFYYGRKLKVPRGKFGVPLPTMSGFVDALMSKIDDPPTLNFGYKDIADLKISQKVSAAWSLEVSPMRGNWPQKDRWEKKQACFCGVGISEIYAESDPEYKSEYRVVDYEDFHCEPMGGGDLDNHAFKGEDNVFKTKNDLLSGVKSGLYDSAQVRLFLRSLTDEDLRKNETLYKSKQERLKRMGLDIEGNTYVGQQIFRFIKWQMEYEGQKYYLVFDYISKTWIRCNLLKDVFSSEKSYQAWQTHEDAFIFWSKAPCDDMRPVCDSVDMLWNQTLENVHKRNSGMRAYDPKMFPDPSELEWRPDGLVAAEASKLGRSIGDGIYEFKVGEITTTVNLIAFLDNYSGRKTGVVPEAQGAVDATDQKVGIYFGNLQQMADRLGLYNKSYRDCSLKKGLNYAYGLYDHLTEKMLVKMIGIAGAEWQELTKGEAKKAPDLDIEITGGAAEVAANEAKSAKREGALKMIVSSLALMGQVNLQWLTKEILRFGSYETDDLKIALNKETISKDEISDAHSAIQLILQGKPAKFNRKATTAFVQEILDYAYDTDLEKPIFDKLVKYANDHLAIAKENMMRKAQKIINDKSMTADNQNGQMMKISDNVNLPEPSPGQNPGVTGNEATSMLKGNMPVTV